MLRIILLMAFILHPKLCIDYIISLFGEKIKLWYDMVNEEIKVEATSGGPDSSRGDGAVAGFESG